MTHEFAELYEYFNHSKPTKLDRYRVEEKFKKFVAEFDFWRLMMSYGHDTLLLLLAEYEKEERYEECAKIKAAIEQHNKMINDNLKTK